MAYISISFLSTTNQLAPKLYHITILCGGWQAVVMERVGGTTAFNQLQQGVIKYLL